MQTFWHVILPSALPELITGSRVLAGMLFATIIAAEMIAARAGLGWMIMDASQFLRSDVIFVGIFILALLVIAILLPTLLAFGFIWVALIVLGLVALLLIGSVVISSLVQTPSGAVSLLVRTLAVVAACFIAFGVIALLGISPSYLFNAVLIPFMIFSMAAAEQAHRALTCSEWNTSALAVQKGEHGRTK